MPRGFYQRASRQCSVEGCGGKHRAGGFCEKHYRRYKRTGTSDPGVGKGNWVRPPRQVDTDE